MLTLLGTYWDNVLVYTNSGSCDTGNCQVTAMTTWLSEIWEAKDCELHMSISSLMVDCVFETLGLFTVEAEVEGWQHLQHLQKKTKKNKEDQKEEAATRFAGTPARVDFYHIFLQ